MKNGTQKTAARHTEGMCGGLLTMNGNYSSMRYFF